jgi:integrase
VNRPPRIPSYRHHKPTNQAIVLVGCKMFYLGAYGSEKSRDEYNRIITEWLADSVQTGLGQRRSRARSDLTIGELILAYWRHVQSYYQKDGQPTSEVDTVRQALRPVKKLYSHTAARDFGPLALRAIQENMIGLGWARSHINRQINRVKRMFSWAVANELLPISVYQALTTVPGLRKGRTAAREAPPAGPVADEIVDRTVEYLPPTVAAMVRLQCLTGMRPQEVVGMRSIDIDMSDPSCWVYRPGRHKTEHHGRDRHIFLGPKAQEVVSVFLSLEISMHLFSPKRSEALRRSENRARRKTPLWPSHETHQLRKRKAEPKRPPRDFYSVPSYRRAIARGCDLAFPHPSLAKFPCKELTPDQQAELKAWRKAHRWHPHQLRHTVATRIRRQFGLEAAQVVLGHSELGTTQVYAEKNLDAAREVTKAIG